MRLGWPGGRQVAECLERVIGIEPTIIQLGKIGQDAGLT